MIKYVNYNSSLKKKVWIKFIKNSHVLGIESNRLKKGNSIRVKPWKNLGMFCSKTHYRSLLKKLYMEISK